MNPILSQILNADQSLLILINSTLSHPILDIFFPFITDLHKVSWFIIPVIGIFLFLFLRKYRTKKGFLLFIFLILNLAATDFTGNNFFKKKFDRLRPQDSGVSPLVVRSPFGGFSFISNHAANMMSFAHYTGYFLPQVKAYTYTIAALVAYSRVYNGVHFPADVIVGLLWGYLVSSLFIALVKRVRIV